MAWASLTLAASTATERRTPSITARSPAVISPACVALSGGPAGSASAPWCSCSPMAPSSCVPPGRYSFTASSPAAGALRPLHDPDAPELDEYDDGGQG
ncbi:hypothetical protein [Streptomyces kronopolitis]|uniref:hypothetical protein n=1 Tax=Streptomyces kronopolitis TaxID=1612435 RepID=UPI0034287863